MLATIENRPVPGYVHNPLPDRYPTRESWPKIGTKGTHKGRPVELMDIWHAYQAVFKTGPYSTMAADLQDFIPCE
jgi:hypothetical protein